MLDSVQNTGSFCPSGVDPPGSPASWQESKEASLPSEVELEDGWRFSDGTGMPVSSAFASLSEVARLTVSTIISDLHAYPDLLVRKMNEINTEKSDLDRVQVAPSFVHRLGL